VTDSLAWNLATSSAVSDPIFGKVQALRDLAGVEVQRLLAAWWRRWPCLSQAQPGASLGTGKRGNEPRQVPGTDLVHGVPQSLYERLDVSRQSDPRSSRLVSVFQLRVHCASHAVLRNLACDDCWFSRVYIDLERKLAGGPCSLTLPTAY
jgi:hypothetical protein